MQTATILYILLAILISVVVVWFQYYYKPKRKGTLKVWLSLLRFIGVFGLLLLIINPKISKNTYSIEKSNLVVLMDNSSSIKTLKGEALLNTFSSNLQNDADLLNTFNLYSYRFGLDLALTDSLDFLESNTNIGKALKSVQEIYRSTSTAIVLLSDGNQTLGNAYEYMGNAINHPIFPVIIGDTTRYEDLRITQINKNKFGFLRNKFPVEIYVSYDGESSVNTVLTISENGKNVFRQNVSFSKTDNSKIVTTNLKAKSIGIKKIKASVVPLQNEKNIANNSRTVALEVIDEKTNIAIISNMVHPDIGALKKAIESNEQRQVYLLPSTNNPKILEDIDIFILYQPNNAFKSVLEYITKAQKSRFIITGTNTDWNFLNSSQDYYKFTSGYPIQEITPVLNVSFAKFDTSDFNVEGLPPLRSNFGQNNLETLDGVIIKPKIRGVELKSPLLSVFEDKDSKTAYLFGEDIWKWRMQTFRNNQNFKNFDEFIGKLVLYLSDSKSKNRFMLDYDNIYQSSADAIITASVFDETFVFDNNAEVILHIEGKKNGISKEVPMLLKQYRYEAKLSDLPAGEYSFTASIKKLGLKKSGSFTILDYDVEKYFLSADRNKLGLLATNTKGRLFYPNQPKELKQSLMSDNRFVPIQRSTEKIVPLVDLKWILGLIIFAFTLEWLLRKYNGLT